MRVRHTPAFGHPSPRGDGCRSTLTVDVDGTRLSPLGDGEKELPLAVPIAKR
jgi:hypothetical protein